MGVRGLWEIVAPAARPVNLENISGYRLAIDASIWIYHFLKAMRDSQGKVLRYAHVVGFFRRICKLIFFGIKPVFVFDGGAPILKRNTILNRKERRKVRKETASSIAAKILTLQLHKHAAEQVKKKKNAAERVVSYLQLSDDDDSSDHEDSREIAYLDEVSVDKDKRTNVFKVKPADISQNTTHDPYFLPEIDEEAINNNVHNDPRLLSHEDVEEYANHVQTKLQSGEYDQEEIDYESPAFKALPLATQYQIISRARLRSRLRMGLTVDQLETQFPDRLAFSKFQINRVKQRNYLTQKLMNMANADGPDVAQTGVKTHVGRIASNRGREYVLQKSENGWTLALENEDIKSNIIKIDVDDTEIHDDELKRKAAKEEEESDDDEDVEWEDVDVSKSPASAMTVSEANPDYMSQLPESLSGFETALQREKLYESLREKAQQGNDPKSAAPKTKPKSEKAFILEDESGDEEQPTQSEPPKPERPEAALEKPRTQEKPETNTGLGQKLSFSKSLFARAAKSSASDATLNTSASAKAPETESEKKKEDTYVPPWFSSDTIAGLTKTKTSSSQEKASIIPSSPENDNDEDEDEDNDELVSYSTVLKRRQRQLYQEESPEINEVVGFDEESSEADEFDDSVQIINPEEFNKPKDTFVSTTAPSATTPVTVGEANGRDSHVGKQSLGEAVKPAEELAGSNKVSPTKRPTDEEIFKPTNYSKEHEEELARMEEEYGEQEDEELMEQLEKEIEETHRFTESFKTQPAPQAAMAGFPTTNTTDPIELQSIESYDDEISALRQQAHKGMRDADEVTPEMVEECQELLRRFGIPFITAPMEAEAQCATLMTMGLVDGIVTDDSDCFLFGGTKVFKNMFSQGDKYVECYDAEDIKREFGLDQHKLIELAYLLGSDYTDGVTGVGPVTAMEILANFDTADGLIRFRDWWKDVQLKGADKGKSVVEGARPETEFERKFKRNAAKIFLSEDFPLKEVEQAYLHPEVDTDSTPFKWGVPDLDALRTFLLRRVGWPEAKTDELLVPVIKAMNKKLTEASTRQTLLKDFFLDIGGGSSNIRSNGTTKSGAAAPGRSSRMTKAITAMSGRMRRREEADLESSSDEEKEQGAKGSDRSTEKVPSGNRTKKPKKNNTSKPVSPSKKNPSVSLSKKK